MKTFPLQTSFAGGEVTDKILGRTESVIYQQGAIIMENMIADSRGPALDRGGTEFESEKAVATEEVLLEEFQVTGDKVYLLRFTPLLLEISTPDGTAPAVGASHVIVHTAGQISTIRVVPVPGGNAAYILHENVAVYKLTYNITTDTFTYAAVTFTAKPTSWTGTNWPAVGAVFQGRLWLGRTPSAPETFWASKSGLFEDFTNVSGNPDEAILAVTMEHYGAIQWMIGTKNFVIGTLTGEYIVKSDTGIVASDDIQIDRQSTHGSSFADARMIGDRIFHISAGGKKIRMMEYSFSKNNWISDEANFFADQLVENDHFTKIVWLPNPTNLLFAQRESGNGTLFTWEAEVEVHGWSPYLLDGALVSCAGGLVNGNSVLTLATNRRTGIIDYEHTPIDPDLDPTYYMDNWVSGTIGGDNRTITGLAHLNGFDCQVLVDGAVHPNETPSGGSITLDFDATSTVIVGLQYTPKVKTMPIDTGSQEGTTKAHFKQFSKYLVHILDSAVPLIDGSRAPTRFPATPMGTPEPLRTDFIEVSLLGWDRQAQVEISQDLPVPLNILAVFGELSQENF